MLLALLALAPCVLVLPFTLLSGGNPAAPAATTAEAPAARPLPAGYVSRADYGDDWPLSVDSAVVECRSGRVVVLTAEGITYALNGTAKDTGRYADIAPIWRDNPSIEGLKISLQPLLDAGLAQC